MDDLSQLFGTKPKTPLEEAWHTEQRRKEFDIIRVYNPSTIKVQGTEYNLPPNDFYIMYDLNQYQKIPFNATLDIPRSRADLYVKHKKDEVINYVNKLKHDTLINERRLKGFPDFKDKNTENDETYLTNAFPKTNDEVLIAEIYDQLWLGLVIRAGSDIPPQLSDPRSGEVDMKPAEVKALENLSKKVIDQKDTHLDFKPTPEAPYVPKFSMPVEQPPQVSPFSQMNKKLNPNEVTVD